MEQLINYVFDEALILIPVLLVLGRVFKETPKMKNWLIPYLLLIIGIALAFFLLGFSVHAAIQGVLVAGAAVFTHQLIKQPQKHD